jgi:hypothetical protein
MRTAASPDNAAPSRHLPRIGKSTAVCAVAGFMSGINDGDSNDAAILKKAKALNGLSAKS